MPIHVLQDGEVQLYTNHPKFPAPNPARVQDCLLDIAANGDTAVQAFKLDLVRDIDNDAGKLIVTISQNSIGNAITELLGVVVNRTADADAYGKLEPRLIARLLEVRRRLVEADLGEGIAQNQRDIDIIRPACQRRIILASLEHCR